MGKLSVVVAWLVVLAGAGSGFGCGDDDGGLLSGDAGELPSGSLDASSGGNSGGSGRPGAGGPPPADVAEAIAELTSEPLTQELALTGEGLGARYDLLRSGGVPAADALIAQGSAAIPALSVELAKGPDALQDEAHAMAAFVLGEIGEIDGLTPLADFLEQSLSGDFPLQAANAATDAIFQILDTTGHGSTPSDRNESLWYTLREMEHAVSLARLWIDLGAIDSALKFRNGSCRMRYVFTKPDGSYYECPDKDGMLVRCAIEGVVFEDVTRVSKESVGLHDQAMMAGAVFPTDFDDGNASRRYNCAGYAFREINRYSGWTGAASDMLDTLTAAGLLRKKSGDPVPGDKIFFRPPEGWKFWTTSAPAHVAEIDRIENGKAIVRAPDNFSGVFELPIDDKYWDEVRSWTYQLYEWVDGPPHSTPDPDFKNNPAYCGDPFDDHCPNADCEIELGETSDTCYMDCTNNDGICDAFEQKMFESSPSSTWATDCGNCGDGFCITDSVDSPESASNCPADCGTCGNGVCDEVDANMIGDECWLDEVNGLTCAQDCCQGTTSLCSTGGSGCE